MLIYRGSFSVFSTYVEVIPHGSYMEVSQSGILHVCGGHPPAFAVLAFDYEYSPRMWRSSRKGKFDLFDRLVFSTYVEVIPAYTVPRLRTLSILHVCGGHPASFSG